MVAEEVEPLCHQNPGAGRRPFGGRGRTRFHSRRPHWLRPRRAGREMSAPLCRCQIAISKEWSSTDGRNRRTPINIFRAHEKEKAARIGFPMGGSRDHDGPTSWWGARTARKSLPRGEVVLPIADRRARDIQAGDSAVLHLPDPHVRHDGSSVRLCGSIIHPSPRMSQCIYQ